MRHRADASRLARPSHSPSTRPREPCRGSVAVSVRRSRRERQVQEPPAHYTANHIYVQTYVPAAGPVSTLEGDDLRRRVRSGRAPLRSTAAVAAWSSTGDPRSHKRLLAQGSGLHALSSHTFVLPGVVMRRVVRRVQPEPVTRGRDGHQPAPGKSSPTRRDSCRSGHDDARTGMTPTALAHPLDGMEAGRVALPDCQRHFDSPGINGRAFVGLAWAGWLRRQRRARHGRERAIGPSLQVAAVDRRQRPDDHR